MAVDLPGLLTLADQSAIGSGATDTTERTSGTSSSFVTLDPSPVTTGAFGPISAGPSGSGYGDVPSPSDTTWGRQDSVAASPAADAMPGQTVPSMADPASGPAFDLSKTNELLQQLLDEVRKGHQPFLPHNDRNASNF